MSHPGISINPSLFFYFQSVRRAALIQFLEQYIPADHVVIFSTMTQYQNSYYHPNGESDGPTNLYTVLEGFGAKEIRNLRSFNSVPYIMIFQKGPEFEVKESIGNFLWMKIEISHSFDTANPQDMFNPELSDQQNHWSKFYGIIKF